MEISILIIIAILIFGIIISTLNKQPKESILVKYPYVSKKQIMTNAEKIFYDKLLTEAGDKHYIVPQAHLSMFIDHKVRNGQSWRGAFSVINGKSVDFLVVEKTTQKPVLAIELDDYTHGRPDRQRRDQVVEEILRRAGIPLQRYASNGQIPTFHTSLQKEPDGQAVTL